MNAELHEKAIKLLKKLIETPSFSKEEVHTAKILEDFLQSENIPFQRYGYNVVAISKHFSPDKKTLLLNSHHDTVRPGNWTYDPFKATQLGEKIIGLGSNDAGASLVSLLMTFVYFYDKNLPFNLIFGASAEEEISGKNGARLMLQHIPKPDLGIIGEPTQMQMAVAEKGLIVLDCTTHGKTGHAARNEGINALYLALEDIAFLRNYDFVKTSELLGDTHLTVTQINAGTQHNVVPDSCNYVVDIRTNEKYNNQEVIAFLSKELNATVNPRSYHLNSSRLDIHHPIVEVGKKLGLGTYGSPTLSDQSVMDFDTLKIGPGKSERSHTPDEYIYTNEIFEGIDTYIKLLEGLAEVGF